MRTLALTSLLLGGCGTIAHLTGLHGGGTAAADLSYRAAVSGDPPVDGVVAASARLRGFAGRDALTAAVGLDLELGVAHPAGFDWRVAAYPLGIATRLGGNGVGGLVLGVGGAGVSGRAPAALELPVEAFATFGLGRGAAGTVWVAPAWLPWSDARGDGAPDAPFADELRAGLTIRRGDAGARWGVSSGRGLHLGLVYGEALDARYLGATIGFDADAGVW